MSSMWIVLLGKERHQLVTALVKDQHVSVYLPTGSTRYYVKFEHATKERAFIVFLTDNGYPYEKVAYPPR